MTVPLKDIGELVERLAVDASCELQLLVIGWGPDGVGPERAHYARSGEVDLFVTPRVAERLRELLEIVDGLYEAAPRGA